MIFTPRKHRLDDRKHKFSYEHSKLQAKRTWQKIKLIILKSGSCYSEPACFNTHAGWIVFCLSWTHNHLCIMLHK